jgi:exodeoxyribonuclease VII large subunit
VAFEQLKMELEAKGYFDPASKKPLPTYPQKIAIVTAAGGAALQDMLKVAQKRWPSVEMTVIDVLVQGEMAAPQIARAIAYADTLGVEIIVVGRGGGSLEDLWAFNARSVAEAIHAARTPVVSAVGHEVDTLISDLVADLRAPTPSAAMEMILPDRDEHLFTLDEWGDRIAQQWHRHMQSRQGVLEQLQERFVQVSPLNRLRQLEERFGDVREAYGRTIHYRLEQFETKRTMLEHECATAMHFALRRKQGEVETLSQRIAMLDPAKRTREGYVEILQNGRRIALESLGTGDRLSLSNGTCTLEAEVVGGGGS